MEETNLRCYRLDMVPRVSQEKVARRANLTLQTYRNAESGGNVSYTTVRAIHAALNQFRKDHGLPVVSIDELGLSIV